MHKEDALVCRMGDDGSGGVPCMEDVGPCRMGDELGYAVRVRMEDAGGVRKGDESCIGRCMGDNGRGIRSCNVQLS